MGSRELPYTGGVAMNKENYSDCRKIIKSFIKKEYWTSFSSADLFYIVDGKNKALFTFVEQFFGDAYGCQLFFTPNGFNYVHDILTTNSEGTVSLADCDSLCAILIPKDELKEEELTFLRKNKFRVMESNNLIIYRFQPGTMQRLANDKEIRIFLNYLEYLSSIISNEFEDIQEAFHKNDTVVAIMDTEQMQYSVIYRPLPYLESMPRKQKANLEFINEFKNCTYVNDECYCFASYLPLIIEETKIRPMIIYFYYPKLKRHYFKYIMSDVKEYKSLIFGILYDVFTEVGVPIKLSFNHRNIYALVVNTITEMNIEHCFIREENNVDSNMNDLIAKIYQQSNDEFIEEENFVQLLMETITKTLNELSSYEEESYEEETSTDFIS